MTCRAWLVILAGAGWLKEAGMAQVLADTARDVFSEMMGAVAGIGHMGGLN